MGLNKKPSQREVQKYIDDLNTNSAELYKEYLDLKSVGVNADPNLLQEAAMLQSQITNVLLSQAIQSTAMMTDQLALLVKRRDKE